MPKGKAKKPAKLSRRDITDAQVSALNERIGSLESEVDELEEAICPRVAARLLALERAVGIAKPAGPSVFQYDEKFRAANGLGPSGIKQAAAPVGRSPCTVVQTDAVARKLHVALGGTNWDALSPASRYSNRRKAYEIIHIVQSVMG